MKHNFTRREIIGGAAALAAASTITVTSGIAAEPTVHKVMIKSFKFDPPNIEVKIGDVIEWVNKDLAPHTATANDSGWDTQKISKKKSARITVSEGMDTGYFCAFHPHMKGSFKIT